MNMGVPGKYYKTGNRTNTAWPAPATSTAPARHHHVQYTFCKCVRDDVAIQRCMHIDAARRFFNMYGLGIAITPSSSR